MDFPESLFVRKVALDGNVTSVDQEMFPLSGSDTGTGSAQDSKNKHDGEESILFWNDDDRGVKIHLNIERLVLLQGIFQPCPSFFPEAF